MLWLAVSMPYVALVVFVATPRTDLGAMISDSRFAFELAAALLTGIAAAVAAFWSVIPGGSRKILLLPLVPLAAWLGSIGFGCLSDWIASGPEGLSIRPHLTCLLETATVSALPAIVMGILLHRGAPLTPFATAALGGLAAAGIGNFGLRLFHPPDASIMVLVWQMGSVFVLTALAGLAGRWLLSWRATVANARRRMAAT